MLLVLAVLFVQKKTQIGTISNTQSKEFAYTSQGKVFANTLSSDSSQALPGISGVEDFQWSRQRNLVILTASGATYLYNSSSKQIQKLSQNIKGSFLGWVPDGSGFIVNREFNANGEMDVRDTLPPGQPPTIASKNKYTLVSLNGNEKDVSFDQAWKIVSVPGFADVSHTYQMVLNPTDTNAIHVNLLKDSKTYSLPDAISYARISTAYSYILLMESQGMGSALKLDLHPLSFLTDKIRNQPIISLENVFQFDWVDDTHFVYLAYDKTNPNQNTYSFYEYDVLARSKKLLAGPISTIYNSFDMSVTADKQNLVYWYAQNFNPDGSKQGAFLVEVSLANGKEIKRTPIDFARFSNN